MGKALTGHAPREWGLKSGSPEAVDGECNSTSLPSKHSHCEVGDGKKRPRSSPVS